MCRNLCAKKSISKWHLMPLLLSRGMAVMLGAADVSFRSTKKAIKLQILLLQLLSAVICWPHLDI